MGIEWGLVASIKNFYFLSWMFILYAANVEEISEPWYGMRMSPHPRVS